MYRTDLAGTSIRKWGDIEQMVDELKGLNPNAHYKANDHLPMAERYKYNMSKLYQTYPFLKLTNTRPEAGNPYLDIQARIPIWRDSYSCVGYTSPGIENQFIDVFLGFVEAYMSRTYSFLPELRPQTKKEAAKHRASALDDF